MTLSFIYEMAILIIKLQKQLSRYPKHGVIYNCIFKVITNHGSHKQDACGRLTHLMLLTLFDL